MFAEKFAQYVQDKTAFTAGLMREADSQIKNLQSCLDDARTELDRLKNAKCEKCGTDLPASGKCIVCSYKKLPTTPDAAFLAGLNSFAWTWVILRRKSLNLNDASLLKVFIEKIYARRNDPDRSRAANQVFTELAESNMSRPMQINDPSPMFSDFEKEFNL